MPERRAARVDRSARPTRRRRSGELEGKDRGRRRPPLPPASRKPSFSSLRVFQKGTPMRDIFSFFEKPEDPLSFQRDPHLARAAPKRSASGRTVR